jgi:hypothetical protein
MFPFPIPLSQHSFSKGNNYHKQTEENLNGLFCSVESTYDKQERVIHIKANAPLLK